MTPKTILVVDDSLEFVNVLEKHTLTPLGCKVIHAADGQNGLDLALTHHPDAIMLDMNLPRMNGLEMLATLRRVNGYVPVIFMTMHGSENIAVEAFRLGVCDYLIKPFTDEEVRQAVSRALRETIPTREREDLDAEIVRQTAITLSHYINNHLMALSGGLNLLQENLQHELPNHPLLSRIVHDGQASITQIKTVIRVLQRITKVRQIPYHNQTRMIDVEAALRNELGQ